jgi:hypothetical protein
VNDDVLHVLLLDVMRQHGRVGEGLLAGVAERPGVAAVLVGLVNGLVVLASSLRPEGEVALGAFDVSWFFFEKLFPLSFRYFLSKTAKTNLGV